MTDPTPNVNPNVDPNEIRKFEDLAWRWWDRDSEFKPLHDINPLRLNYIDDHARLQGKNVIDIGCGGGILAESMARRGATVTGIDMGATPLEVAELHALESQVEVTYRQISAEAIATEAPEQFDVVTCMEMLEHVPDPASVIAACAALVKPGGDVFFSTLNRNPKAFALAILGAEYVLNMLPKGTHEYAKFIKPSELERWARSVGLELRNIAGMTYNPLFQSYRLGNDVDVNYLMYFKKEM
ncbi:bifunctional 2-polyprenyl-6-hydroxyphenol methylase/3-demethylubiquinol 3-O-methyltransferase UbiG [Thiothrix winogradskyi]|uniref:Ubiquinone biosynthesis O-methyltransferase n=1 Tax=Thiothrix winogradskyi TaxID=96472 RepID=A0ABY3SYZ5_9GAMM|nr:bifunctional 2-polyprenyl-6-hydroxyphenol methylase/3-demethylubiquinol 3-O-methyltransferase UbiG [Thiothrix winogradskyi]UJS23859.1 bifunctional 2-polyprenyl-6-hydroxyphenol methylase/3-demethylubiquinol 3-O-methyltransferase UbiG [Thiothrix winogradskyi]